MINFPIRKGDVVIVAAVLVLVVASILAVKPARYNNGKMPMAAIIRQDGKIIRTIDLGREKQKGEFTVKSEFDNVISYEDGKIRFKESNCPDRLCVRTGWIEMNGQIAVCVPNRVSIKIEKREDGLDGVSY